MEWNSQLWKLQGKEVLTISSCVAVSVTTSRSVSQAISFVMENKGLFDIVISEVYLPGEDAAFKLLEVVGVGLGLSVISE